MDKRDDLACSKRAIISSGSDRLNCDLCGLTVSGLASPGRPITSNPDVRDNTGGRQYLGRVPPEAERRVVGLFYNSQVSKSKAGCTKSGR